MKRFRAVVLLRASGRPVSASLYSEREDVPRGLRLRQVSGNTHRVLTVGGGGECEKRPLSRVLAGSACH